MTVVKCKTYFLQPDAICFDGVLYDKSKNNRALLKFKPYPQVLIIKLCAAHNVTMH